MRFTVIEEIVRTKFADAVLRKKLISTGNRKSIEGNTWRDTAWGAVKERTIHGGDVTDCKRS